MSILNNIHPILRQSRLRRGKNAVIGSSFSPWPYVDNLFDFTQVVGPGLQLANGIAPGKKVAIVGAGAAGLCAGFELLKCGVMPTIFEAGNRYGGRLWSRPFTDGGGAFAEMGAMRVPPSQRTIGLYAQMFGMQAANGGFPDPGKVPTTLYYENQAYVWAAGDNPPGIFGSIADDFSDWINALAQPLYTPWEAGDMTAVSQVWQGYIDTYKNMSFYEALVQAMPNWTTETFNAFGALGVGSGGFGPLYNVGMLEMLRILLLGWEDNQQLYIDGMSSLCDGFYTTTVNAPGIGNCSLQSLGAVKLNSPIMSIEYNAITKRPGVVREGVLVEEYDAVIVATTTRAMEFMGLTMPSPVTDTPNLVSEPVKEGLRNLHMTCSSKMFIRTATKFWLDVNGNPLPGVPQTIQTDALPRGIYALDYPNTSNGVVAVSYTWEDDSVKLQAMDVAKRFTTLVTAITKIDATWGKSLLPMNAEVFNIDWQSEPYFYGAFKLNLPGQEPGLQAAYYQFLSALTPATDKGVYLAGDGVSYSGGWTEGALQTAINCATAVTSRLGGTLPSYNALADQSASLYDYGDVKLLHRPVKGGAAVHAVTSVRG